MEKVTGFLIFICLLILCVYFLDKGKISSGSFAWLISVLLICGLAFYGFDRLKELNLGSLKIVLSEMKTVKAEVIETKKRVIKINEISQLGNRAGWHNAHGGDSQSYEILIDTKKKIIDPEIRKLILSEIETIESNYSTDIMRLWIERPIAICKTAQPPCSKGFEPSGKFNAPNVFQHLNIRPLWTERARAASLLRNIKTSPNKSEVNKEELFDSLVKHMDIKYENSLFVRKMALETYKDLAGFKSDSTNVFDFISAIEDWKQRKTEILKLNY